jgi:hypothetical protein
VIAASAAGHRAGLHQRGGSLVVLGPLGRLAGERQAGGHFFVRDREVPSAVGAALHSAVPAPPSAETFF